VVLITIGALVALNTSVLGAIVGWVLGMLWVRVVFEVMIVLFRINDGIQTMARRR
jgi:membrane protein YqaA with SNARE-associated domain